jgi:hypothetical protein
MSFLFIGFQKTEDEIIKETKRKNNRRITQLEKEASQARNSIELCKKELIKAHEKKDTITIQKIEGLIKRHYYALQSAEGEITELVQNTAKIDKSRKTIDRLDRVKTDMMLTQRLQSRIQPQSVMQMQYQLEQQKDKLEMAEETLDEIMASSMPELGEETEEPAYLREIFSSAKDMAEASSTLYTLPSVPTYIPGSVSSDLLYQQTSSSSSFVRK